MLIDTISTFLPQLCVKKLTKSSSQAQDDAIAKALAQNGDSHMDGKLKMCCWEANVFMEYEDEEEGEGKDSCWILVYLSQRLWYLIAPVEVLG